MLPLLFNLNFYFMPKNSVLSRPQVSAAPSRHDFDRSFVSNFNQSAGMIIPVFCEQVIAGTKGVINARRFTRTKNVVFPAFQQVTQHIDFYAVPLRFLWSFWNDFKLNINDLNSSLTQNLDTIVGTKANGFVPSVVPFMNYNPATLLVHYNSNNYSIGSLSARLQKFRDATRLFDALGYPGYNGNFGVSDRYILQLFPLAAYQKVYYDHFRNTSYENNNAFAYNLDWLSVGGASGELDYDNASKPEHCNAFEYLTELHHVNYRNDYFKNIYPSLSYSLTTPIGSDWTLPSDIVGLGVNTTTTKVMNTLFLNTGSTSGTLALSTDTIINGHANSVTPQGLRALFAMDRLLRASAYAPKHVADQIKARFGVDVPKKAVSFESQHLGSFMNDIVFGEVTSTADTSAAGDPSNLGEIGGKGVGASDFGQDIHFYAEEDSIIIGVQYFLPRAMYDANGVKAWNKKFTRNDFFQPEFEHLGLRPLYNDEYDLPAPAGATVLGYKEPNQEYKVGIDLNHGLFKKNYHEPKLNSDEDAIIIGTEASQLNAFVVHNKTITSTPINYRYFKCLPEDLDYIFEENYLGTQASDQFYGNLRFKFAVNAPMSVHGNPML